MRTATAPQNTAQQPVAQARPITAPVVDPQSEAKLLAARPRLLQWVQSERPRFVQAFEQMSVAGNRITISVGTPDLQTEVQRVQTTLLQRFMEIAAVQGELQLEVQLNEEIRAARPIKWEDRIKFIQEKNPLVANLRKALDLEIE